MNLKRFWISAGILSTFVIGVSLVAYATGKITSLAFDDVTIDQGGPTDFTGGAVGSAIDSSTGTGDLVPFPADQTVPNYTIDSSGNIVSADPNLDPNASGTDFPVQSFGSATPLTDSNGNIQLDANGNVLFNESAIGNTDGRPACPDGTIDTGTLCVRNNDYIIGTGNALADNAAQAIADYNAAQALADKTGLPADKASADLLKAQADSALAKANARSSAGTGTKGKTLNPITPPPAVQLQSFLQTNFASLDSILRIGIPRLLISFVGLITLIFFLINAVKFLFGAGNEKSTTEGKQGMAFAGIGFGIVIAAYLIVTFAASVFK